MTAGIVHFYYKYFVPTSHIHPFFSNLPLPHYIYQLTKRYLPNDNESLSATVTKLLPKIKNTVGGIFAKCFDGTDSIDLNCYGDIELLIVSLLRAELLKSAQKDFYFSYSDSLSIEGYDSFLLHNATVESFFPRCEKYACSPRNVTFVGKLGDLYRHYGWSSIMRTLSPKLLLLEREES